VRERRQRDAPGRQLTHNLQRTTMAIDEHDVDREAHKRRVDGHRRHENQRRTRIETVATEQPAAA